MEMQVDMNGLRLNIARAYNQMCRELNLDELDINQKEAIEELRMHIGGLLCVYDNDSLRDLSEEIELFDVLPDDY